MSVEPLSPCRHASQAGGLPGTKRSPSEDDRDDPAGAGLPIGAPQAIGMAAILGGVGIAFALTAGDNDEKKPASP